MATEQYRPIHFLSNIPQGWLDASLPKFNATLQENLTSEQRITAQEGRWKEVAGVSPEDTRLTIIVPIRNERVLLETTLGALALSDIPRSTHTTFLFVTNNCTDKGESGRVIRTFMERFGAVSEQNVDENLFRERFDPMMDNTYQSVKVGNTEFIHLNTETAGKANALNLGNSIALQRKSIAMCIDADTAVEPDAIAHLYRNAYDIQAHSDSRVAIVQGTYKSERLKEDDIPDHLKQLESLKGLTPKDLLPIIKNSDIKIRGAFWAWNPTTMQNLGGMPNVANEDMAYWMLLTSKGYKIQEAKDAFIWGFIDESFKSRRKMLIRLVRAWKQTVRLYPELEPEIRRMFLNLKNDETGLTYDDLVQWQQIEENRHISAEALPQIFALWVAVYKEGLAEFNRVGSEQSWDPSERRTF